MGAVGVVVRFAFAQLPAISADRFPAFLEVIPKLWEEIAQRAAERGESQQSEDFDEEELEVLQAEGQTDEEMQEMIVQCMGGFFKAFGAQFLQVRDVPERFQRRRSCAQTLRG